MVHIFRFALLYLCLIAPALYAGLPTPPNGLADYRKEYMAIAAATSAEQMHEMLADRQRRLETYLRHLADTVPGHEKAPGITLEENTFRITISADKNQQFESPIDAMGGFLISLMPESENRDELVADLLEKGMSDVDLDSLLTHVLSKDNDSPSLWMRQTRRYLEERTRFAHLLTEDIQPWTQLDDAELKEALITLKAAGAYGNRARLVDVLLPLSYQGRVILFDMMLDERGGTTRTVELTEEVTDATVAETRRQINLRVAEQQTP